MTQTPPARPTVVVLGGGYADVQVARPLDDLADVVLVEPKDHFVHNVAALRALVDPSWLERIYLPYTALLGAGRVMSHTEIAALFLPRASSSRPGDPIGFSRAASSSCAGFASASAECASSLRYRKPSGKSTLRPVLPNARWNFM